MNHKLLSIAALTVALPLLLTSCSPAEEPVTDEVETSEEAVETREEQPEEVSAIENYAEFSADIEDFGDLTEYEEHWMQLAPLEEQDENSISVVWFGTATPENAVDISNAIIELDGWASDKMSSPQTPEEQLEAVDAVADDDPLEMSGTVHLDDGSSMSVSVSPDDNLSDELVHYMFSINKAV